MTLRPPSRCPERSGRRPRSRTRFESASQSPNRSLLARNTILGIRPLNWFWLWLITGSYMAYLYSTMVSFHIIAFLICGGSIFFMYNILCGRILGQKNILIRILAFVGVYIGGFVVGIGLQWLFSTILFYILPEFCTKYSF